MPPKGKKEAKTIKEPTLKLSENKETSVLQIVRANFKAKVLFKVMTGMDLFRTSKYLMVKQSYVRTLSVMSCFAFEAHYQRFYYRSNRPFFKKPLKFLTKLTLQTTHLHFLRKFLQRKRPIRTIKILVGELPVWQRNNPIVPIKKHIPYAKFLRHYIPYRIKSLYFLGRNDEGPYMMTPELYKELRKFPCLHSFAIKGDYDWDRESISITNLDAAYYLSQLRSLRQLSLPLKYLARGNFYLQRLFNSKKPLTNFKIEYCKQNNSSIHYLESFFENLKAVPTISGLDIELTDVQKNNVNLDKMHGGLIRELPNLKSVRFALKDLSFSYSSESSFDNLFSSLARKETLQTLQIQLEGHRISSCLDPKWSVLKGNPNLSTLKLECKTVPYLLKSEEVLTSGLFENLGKSTCALKKLTDFSIFASSCERGSARTLLSHLKSLNSLETLLFQMGFNPSDEEDINSIGTFLNQQTNLRTLHLGINWAEPSTFKLFKPYFKKLLSLHSLLIKIDQFSKFNKGELSSSLKNLINDIPRLVYLKLELKYEPVDADLIELLNLCKEKRLLTFVLSSCLSKVTKKAAVIIAKLVRELAFMNQLVLRWSSLLEGSYAIISKSLYF